MKRTLAAAVFLFVAWATSHTACACEVALTSAEIAGGRARAVVLLGPAQQSYFGGIVSAVGDANGDGFNDFVITSSHENSNAGALYLVFGRSAEAWASAQFDFNASNSPDALSWIRISGEDSTYFGSYSVARGDFNGDGLGDFLALTNTNKAFCVYGHNFAWSSFTTTDIENGVAPGFVLSGANYAGNAGDMNGDGIEDLFANAGNSAFVVFGTAGSDRSNLDLASINGTNGFELFDETSCLGVGTTFGPAGDVNGDGLDDLSVGSYFSNNAEGRTYILFSRNVSATGKPWPASVNITAEIDGTNGFIVHGPNSSSRLGSTVVGAGDVNGDGYADVFIGSSGSDSGSWVVFGHPAPWVSPINASELDGSNGFRFASSGTENWGYSGAIAGDINGDGFDDIIVGGRNALNSARTLATGAAVVIFGHNGSWPAELNRGDAAGSMGFFIDGPSGGSLFGYSAKGAGDVNGDGIADFIVGAFSHNNEQGYVALVFGVADDHCTVCSNFTEACLVCDDGFFLNGTICEFGDPPFLSSSSSGSAVSTVVVVETGNSGSSASELAAEVAQLLGVDVGQISVIEITPGTFEVTVINQDVAKQLVDLVGACIQL